MRSLRFQYPKLTTTLNLCLAVLLVCVGCCLGTASATGCCCSDTSEASKTPQLTEAMPEMGCCQITAPTNTPLSSNDLMTIPSLVGVSVASFSPSAFTNSGVLISAQDQAHIFNHRHRYLELGVLLN